MMSLAAAACVYITSYYIIIISGGAKVGIGRAQAQQSFPVPNQL